MRLDSLGDLIERRTRREGVERKWVYWYVDLGGGEITESLVEWKSRVVNEEIREREYAITEIDFGNWFYILGDLSYRTFGIY